MPNKGLFITVEGCEGSGKTTQLNLLRQHFASVSIPAVFTREPGGTALAESIRSLILSPDNEMDALTELLLYQAARRDHVNTVIAPALKEGKVVICDRFIHSTAAYQGHARGLSLSLIDTLNKAVVDGVSIDLTIFLDLAPIDGFTRKGGADKTDRMDSESMDFHNKVYEGFKKMCDGVRMVAVDGGQSKEVVFKSILRLINERYRHKRFFI